MPDQSDEYLNRSAKIENELFEGYSDELLTFASITCIVFIIVGVPGNILTIVALSRGKQTRNSTAVFIMNLSLSDLLFGCFNLPLAASTFMKRSWAHSDLLCRLFPLLRYGLMAVSLFTVSLITINRYIIIAHPRQYPRIYQRHYLALMVAGTWVTPLAFMMPTWRGIWGRFGLDAEIGSCSILPDANGRSPKEFLFVIAFMVPCICIVVCYARIFYLVRKAAFRTREPPAKNISFRNEPTPPPPQTRRAPATGGGAGTGGDVATKGGRAKKSTPPAEDAHASRPFFVDADIEYIDVSDSNDNTPISYKIAKEASVVVDPKLLIKKQERSAPQSASIGDESPACVNEKFGTRSNPIKTSLKTSFTRFSPRKSHYVSMGNTSNASSIYPGRMSYKDRRLLKMILVIFVTFVICYLPITITKIVKSATDIHIINISGYLLVYLTTCINPLIYVLMSSEYRQAYWSLVRCQCDQKKTDFNRTAKT